MIFVLLLTLFVVIFYFYVTRNHDYWARRNVKHDKPVPFFGNHYRNAMGKRSITEIAVELYHKYSGEKVIGYYRGTTPELLVRDLDIARKILSVDFAYFHYRGLGRDPDVEPILANLFHVDGDTWKLLRHRLTIAFTTAKLKKMFPLVVECAENLYKVGENIVYSGGECDVRELMARFTTDFIGACGFGVQMNAINDEHSLFRELGRKIFDPNWKNDVLVATWDLLPGIRKIFQYILGDNDVLSALEEILVHIREKRNYKPCGRNDFVDLLLELETKGTMKGESIEKRCEDGKAEQVELEMDVKLMAAQMFFFFAAGFETSSSATSYTLHELAYHPEIQERIQAEIDEVLKKYDNKLCYDSISEMSLLSMAFKEGMRIFPSVGVLHRVCTQRYTIPELGFSIDRGVRIMVPIQAIQKDERYYDNPEQFNPERFRQSPGERHKYTFLPFGEGPRSCIGARLGEMQSLAGLAAVLHKFSLEPAPSSQRHLELDHRVNVTQGLIGGIPLKLTLRRQYKE